MNRDNQGAYNALTSIGVTGAKFFKGTENLTERFYVKQTGDIWGNTITLVGFTVATLPTPLEGMRCYVTDATSTTFASTVVGGGANKVPVFYNGTNWIIA